MLGSYVLNSVPINGALGEYRVLGGSVLTSCSDTANLFLIKSIEASSSVSALVEGLVNVNWNISSNILVNSGISGVLYKSSILNSFISSSVTIDNVSLYKSSILNANINVSVVTDTAVISSLLHFFGSANVTTFVNAELLLVVKLGGQVIGYVIVDDTNLDVTKRMQAAESVIASIINSHLVHIYFHSTIELELAKEDIIISEIDINYIQNGG